MRLLVGLVALVFAGSALAQSYPNRPVKMIVPFAAAGPTDVIARLIAQKLTDSLGKTFYVENHPGAGGNIGMGMAAGAPADGYTILVVSSSFVVNPSLYAKIPYDPHNSFIPITVVGVSPNVLTVHPSIPAKSVRELVDLIKANPGKYNFASPGVGTTPHLSGELFRLSTGIDLVHVPFNGAGPAIGSAVGGHTPIAFTALPPAAPQIKAGNLRALAVTSAKRSPALPEVPTMAEAGFSGQEADTLQGILVPAGTPKEIVDLLFREIIKAVALPDVKERFAALGFEVVANSGDEFAAQITAEIAKWGKVIREAKIKAE
jgi:tripartite-type tricarboxylate transporter receptor subunit TctC